MSVRPWASCCNISSCRSGWRPAEAALHALLHHRRLSPGGAIVARYGRPIPWAAWQFWALAGFAAFCWFMFVDPDLTWRVLVMNFAFGGISLLVAAEIRAVPSRGPVEEMLMVLALLSALNFFARTLVSMALHGPYVTYDGFYTSVFWTTALLSHAVLVAHDRALPLHRRGARPPENAAVGIADRSLVGPAQPARLRGEGCGAAPDVRAGKAAGRADRRRPRPVQGAERPAWTCRRRPGDHGIRRRG